MVFLSSRPASLLDLDGDLAAAAEGGGSCEELRRLASGRTLAVERGPADVVDRVASTSAVLGLYVAAGVLFRETVLGSAALPELLGPGALLTPPAAEGAVVPTITRISCVEDATLVVLGPSLTAAFARSPTLYRAVEERRAEQVARASTFAAIGHQKRVEVRVLAMLWHLAETWGRVVPEGTVVPFPLTHAELGRFVRAQRPTVTLAITDLERSRHVRRLEDGTWLLPPASREALVELIGPPAAAHPTILRARVSRERPRAAVERSVQARRSAADVLDGARALAAESLQARRHGRS